MKGTFIATALAAILLAGTAFAADHRPVAPSAPEPIADVGTAGTISGTVVATERGMFVIDDGSGTVRIAARPFAVRDIRPGEQVTVTGRRVRDGIMAFEIIREDGSVVAGPGRRHGLAEEHGRGREHRHNGRG